MAWPFQKPVDRKEVPDYYDHIKYPMGKYMFVLLSQIILSIMFCYFPQMPSSFIAFYKYGLWINITLGHVARSVVSVTDFVSTAGALLWVWIPVLQVTFFSTLRIILLWLASLPCLIRSMHRSVVYGDRSKVRRKRGDQPFFFKKCMRGSG